MPIEYLPRRALADPPGTHSAELRVKSNGVIAAGGKALALRGVPEEWALAAAAVSGCG